jgi:hypothetical protein
VCTLVAASIASIMVSKQSDTPFTAMAGLLNWSPDLETYDVLAECTVDGPYAPIAPRATWLSGLQAFVSGIYFLLPIYCVVTCPRRSVEISVQLKDMLGTRNVAALGPTTLKATLCSGLLQMAGIKTGNGRCLALHGIIDALWQGLAFQAMLHTYITSNGHTCPSAILLRTVA